MKYKVGRFYLYKSGGYWSDLVSFIFKITHINHDSASYEVVNILSGNLPYTKAKFFNGSEVYKSSKYLPMYAIEESFNKFLASKDY